MLIHCWCFIRQSGHMQEMDFSGAKDFVEANGGGMKENNFLFLLSFGNVKAFFFYRVPQSIFFFFTFIILYSILWSHKRIPPKPPKVYIIVNVALGRQQSRSIKSFILHIRQATLGRNSQERDSGQNTDSQVPATESFQGTSQKVIS